LLLELKGAKALISQGNEEGFESFLAFSFGSLKVVSKVWFIFA
jgi:hypothetical protein